MFRAARRAVLPALLAWLAILSMGATRAACPPALPPSVYATRCTGGEVRLPGGQLRRDCHKGRRPAIPMASAILRLMEKLRCRVGDKVVVTSGYRSPAHNAYLWAWVAARRPGRNSVSRRSRHTGGGAVDFYVKGYSHPRLIKLARMLKQWAGKLPKPLRGSRESIWVRVYRKEEGREPDNLHPFPYIHLELRE